VAVGMAIADKAIIICGSTKCGTTSVYDYLSFYANIIPSSRKETRFFLEKEVPLARNFYYEDDKLNYRKFFAGKDDDKTLLEATPDYMYSPAARYRIKRDVRRPVLVFVLRNPVERFLSWYEYSKQKALIPLSMTLREYIEEQDLVGKMTTPQYYRTLEQGIYQEYLSLWEREFSESVCIIDFEALKSSRPEKVLKEVLKKAGLNPNSIAQVGFPISNKTFSVKNQRVQKGYERTLSKGRLLLSHHHRTRKFFRFINRVFLKPIFLAFNVNRNYVASYRKDDLDWLKDFYEEKGVFGYLSGLRFKL
jgi:hypothetical protein